MQKIFILLSSVCLLQLSSIAQSYTPLLDNFNEWHFTTCFSGCPTDIYYTDGDTVVNGVDYKVLDGFHYISRSFLLTEDTLARTVSLTRVSSKIDTYLLYDFSLNVGDSIDIQNPISPFPATPGYFRVDSIQMRMLDDGNDYKHFYLSVINPTAGASNAVWIEGVGSLSLINAPGGLNDINGTGHLSCFFKEGVGHYSNLDSIVSCDPTNFPSLINSFNGIEINLFPNPTSGDVYIAASESIDYVEIINLSGQVLETKQILSHFNAKIDMKYLKEGIYFINLHFTTGESAIRRVVKG